MHPRSCQHGMLPPDVKIVHFSELVRYSTTTYVARNSSYSLLAANLKHRILTCTLLSLSKSDDCFCNTLCLDITKE